MEVRLPVEPVYPGGPSDPTPEPIDAEERVPGVEWEIMIGGPGADRPQSVRQTGDGGYIAAGYSDSEGGDFPENKGGNDAWIVKLDGKGGIEWKSHLGGTYNDFVYSIKQTSDGGYIAAGESDSDGGDSGDFPKNKGGYDAWIVKLNGAGDIDWQKCLGGSRNDYADFILQTNEGGYILAGMTNSTDGDISEDQNHGGLDYWIVKLDENGEIVWQKCFGGSNDDEARSIQQTDGGYVVAGISSSNDGDVTGNHGNEDYWVVKLDENGEIVWRKCFGGSGNDEVWSLLRTSDGGYIVTGDSNSIDGDISGNHGGQEDGWIIKLDGDGDIEWQKCVGGTRADGTTSVVQTPDGGYVIAGESSSNDGDVSGNHGGGDDVWIVKLSGRGVIEWQKCFGGSRYEDAYSIYQTDDGGYVFAGPSDSTDGDISENQNHGGLDYWIVKLKP
jgi:hypothetical protein